MKTLKPIPVLLVIISIFCSCTSTPQKDWDSTPINAPAGEGKNWKLIEELSDDFNYEGKTTEEFTSKWRDTYIGKWNGPGLTQWRKKNAQIKNGNLEISANRSDLTMPYKVNGQDTILPKVDCGIVTSKTKIGYPAYVEMRMKVMNQTLSSNFWFLSQNSRQELDVIECYGSDRPDHSIKSTQMGTNWHIFERSPERGIYGNHSFGRPFSLPGNEPLRNNYHTYAAHWIDAQSIDWYLNGILIRQTRADSKVTGDKKGITPFDDIEDPEQNKGMYEEMYMIIDVEDHDWRSKQGIISTDEELSDSNKNVMYVDWVRVYKPDLDQ